MAATRTSRRGGGGTAAPVPTVSQPRQRPPSPLSPARTSRIDEKRQMQLLNTRLATYIEAVQARDTEIRGLKLERTSVEEVHTSELTQIKGMYNRELEQLRAAVDNISREKAKLEIDSDKHAREASEAKSELAIKSKLLATAERDLAAKTQRLADVEGRLAVLDDEVRRLRPESAKRLSQLEDAKRNLEDETLRSTDLQNQLITMQEGLKFENSMLEQQLSESRVRKQLEITELDGRLNDEYEKKLHTSLDELRSTYEQQISENREEFGRVYDDKIQKLQAKLDHERATKAGNAQEVREMTTKISALTSRNAELESSKLVVQQRIGELVRDMEDKDAAFRSEMAKKDSELRSKDEQLEEMLKDYKDLMEIKVALDVEIAAYRKMLDLEEARLGLLDGASPSPPHGVKRRRTYMEEEDAREMVSDHSGLGNVSIGTVEKGGSCIKVTNVGKDEVSIGGWTLANAAADVDCSYKFPRSISLAAGATCAVWSSDSGQDPSPPTTLVMKKGRWTIGAENKTTLVNKEGAEEARRLSREQQRQVGTYRMRRGGINSQETSSCAIM